MTINEAHRPPPGMRTLGTDKVLTRLVLVRHGEPTSAVLGIVAGAIGDTGLTDAGRAQVTQLAGRLAESGELASAAALYASTLPRAIETAELLAGALGGLEVTVRHELREHDPGALDGLTWTEAAERHALPDFETHPEVEVAAGGESLAGFHTRARAALQQLAEAHTGETVVVACHGGIVASGIGMVFGIDVHDRVFLPTRYASMTDLELTSRGWRLGRYNDRYPVTHP